MKWQSLVVVMWLIQPAFAAAPPGTVNAADGIFAAFETHSIVGMHNDEGGDNHDLAQQQDFYSALVRDPRFARQVGNIVVEFGDAIHQGILDRYIGGDDV